MNNPTLSRLSAVLLIVVPLAFMGFFTLLGINFDYPNILRQPAEVVLQSYQTGGTGLILTWYGMAMTALLFIPTVILLHRSQAQAEDTLMLVATVFGVLAGLVQLLGFIRWPFMVNYLSQTYLAPETTDVTREAINVVFQSFNVYAGVSIGENLGYLLTAVWTILTAIALLRAGRMPAPLAWAGVVLGGGILIGILEPFGVEAAGQINSIAYLVWAVWLVLVGITLLIRKSSAR